MPTGKPGGGAIIGNAILGMKPGGGGMPIGTPNGIIPTKQTLHHAWKKRERRSGVTTLRHKHEQREDAWATTKHDKSFI